MPVHAGDADGREQAADRRRDQAHEQRDQHRDADRRRPCQTSTAKRVRQQRHGDEQEDDVRPASRMSSAISFGVFWRLAPSTIAIMRSRKVSPGLAVISHDDPVGEHARAAGHRGAVAAALADHGRGFTGDRASSTDATPSIDLAIGRESTRPPRPARGRRAAAAMAGTLSIGRSRSADSVAAAWRGVRLRCARSVSACALPRPSAMASAKLANSTVNHSQSAICER